MKGSSDMPIPRPKIPTSLSIVSYIFFAVGLFGAMDGFIGMAVAKTDLSLSHLLTLILGIVYLFLSRGLRQCSCVKCRSAVVKSAVFVPNYRRRFG